jgi:hypothetical protein
VRGLGGKLGETVVSDLGVDTMGQLAALSLRQIAAKFEEKTAQWLHLLGRGGNVTPPPPDNSFRRNRKWEKTAKIKRRKFKVKNRRLASKKIYAIGVKILAKRA